MSRRACSAAAIALVLAAGAAPLHAASLTVPRTPAPAGVSRSAATLPSAVSSTSDIVRIAKAKADTWRSIPDVFSAPGVDWSPHANRRSGWRPPATKLVRSHRAGLASATTALATAPDTFRVAFIRIDFAHDSERGGGSTGNGRFDLSTPGAAAPPIDRAPHNRAFYLDHLEALSRYYKAESYGRTVITGDVWPRTQNGAYTVSDMADYGPWKFSTSIYGAAVHMFRSMMFAADTQSTALGDRIPWDRYDRIVVIHAGSDLQSDVSRDSPEDIPSFTLGVTDTDVVIFRDSTAANRERPIRQATFIPEHVNQDGYYGAINGVIAHECGHLIFGFVDLYNVDTGYPVVGLWSLMDSGNLAGSIVALPDGTNIYATGLLPPSVDPWQRAFCGDALTFQPVAYGDTMAIRNSERYPDMRRVDLTSDEYLILENRWLAPSDSVELDQADSTRVILGPKKPDRYEYDALLPVRVDANQHTLPGAGILAWHIDESVIPSVFETQFPCDTLRANRECGFNTGPRLAISVLEADGLQDLGDPNSPYILGAPRDPWFHSNNPVLGDSTRPNLRPHIGTYPHIQLNFLDEPDSIMHVAAFRSWQLPGWPLRLPLPKSGPQPLAIDLDGDRLPEVVWAGGREDEVDSAAVIAVKANGDAFYAVSPTLLGRKPNPIIAAIGRDAGGLGAGPAVIAVTTLPGNGPPAGRSGRVWLIDPSGAPVEGWPPLLPSQVTTPPVIASAFGDTMVYVGCANGIVYALNLAGTVIGESPIPLAGGVRGRLAVFPEPLQDDAGNPFFAVVAGGGGGDVTVLEHVPSANAGDGVGMPALPGWPVHVASGPFVPDFLMLDFGGLSAGQESIPATGDCTHGALSVVVHNADRLWAYCLRGTPLPGWGQSAGDTIVSGLAAGDPDGDGFPEVITQTRGSQVAFWDIDGRPQPGWPKRGTPETFRSGAAPIAANLDGTGGTEMITLNASGIVDAFDLRGKQPSGWPLAAGIGAAGTPLLADLNGDRQLELVVADSVSRLYAYTLPTTVDVLAQPSWPMLGGDPQRSSSLPAARTPVAAVPASGPLVRGTLKAYPNPARRKPVTFAYTLTEPGTVEFRILDTAGHEVASFKRPARQADNVETWDPGALPAGLYIARLKFKGATSDRVETVPIGLLR